MPTSLQTDQSILYDYYREAEDNYYRLIRSVNLDEAIKLNPGLMDDFQEILNNALITAYKNHEGCPRAHLFLQRTLYYINRLKLFWFDDLKNYVNESSSYLFAIRHKIETAWIIWEESHIKTKTFNESIVKPALKERVEEDLNASPSKECFFLANEMSLAGYKRLLAITSLDGLVEASQLSRVIGGVGNETQMMLAKILWEEYGSGKLTRKHSSYFIEMLKTCNMETRPEAYLDLVPWEVLANINHSFHLSERKEHYLRYVGGLLYIEVSAPSSFSNYKNAGERIGLGKVGTGYWDIHIQEDIRHGQWMLNDVALPLAKQYKDQAWQIVFGYDQQKFISLRAIKSIVESIREVERS